MDSSCSSDVSDWDIVGTDECQTISKDIIKDNAEETVAQETVAQETVAQESVAQETSENLEHERKADAAEESKPVVPGGTCVEEVHEDSATQHEDSITQHEDSNTHHEDSNTHHDDSSSDVDVIETNVDDSLPASSHTSFMQESMAFSHTSTEGDGRDIPRASFAETTTSTEPEQNTSAAAPPPPRLLRWFINEFMWGRVKDWAVALVMDHIRPNRDCGKMVLVAFTITLLIITSSVQREKETTAKKEERFSAYAQVLQRLHLLESENRELKSQVLSKIQDDRLFVMLEEQISHLKNENAKLSGSMEELIEQLERQTDIFRKENLREKHGPYREEIDRLKEQVNILKIDNEDLQKQLVRMRYGSYPSTTNHRTDDKDKDERKPSDTTQNDEDKKNSSEIVTEEIKELRKKVFLELEKLKNWKESVHYLLKELSSMQEEDSTNPEKQIPEHDEKKSKKHHKNKFYEWSWKDVKKHFKVTLDSLPNINVSEMFSKYVNVDRKKVENVFESINHYFKKAQEKTKNIVNSYSASEETQEQFKNSFWNQLTGLKEKWSEMKHKIFDKMYDGAQYGNENGQSEFANSFQAEHSKFKKQYHKHSHEGAERVHHGHKETEKFPHQEMTQKPSEADWHGNKRKDPVNPDVLEPQDRSVNLEQSFEAQESESEQKDWLFQRAALRSEFRDEEKEEENWFLRKKRESEENLK